MAGQQLGPGVCASEVPRVSTGCSKANCATPGDGTSHPDLIPMSQANSHFWWDPNLYLGCPGPLGA